MLLYKRGSFRYPAYRVHRVRLEVELRKVVRSGKAGKQVNAAGLAGL